MTGFERFDTYLKEWEKLAEKANASDDAAEYCLNSNARTIFFMMESLCKIYKTLHNEKLFSKEGDRFKTVEDLLGGMDHYRECINDFSQKENIPDEVVNYFKDNYQKEKNDLNTLLTEKGWLNGKRPAKVRKKLEDADWMGTKKEMDAIRKYYIDEIAEFKNLFLKTGTLTVVEDHLHEFRRRLRWFSIYPHAMQGAIQFSADAEAESGLMKYQTAEIVSSPFNTFPPPGNQTHILLLEKNHFLALSWVIDALGKLKDKGLLEENLLQANEATNGSIEVAAIAQSEQEILRDANQMMKTFMNDKVLENLVGEVKAINLQTTT